MDEAIFIIVLFSLLTTAMLQRPEELFPLCHNLYFSILFTVPLTSSRSGKMSNCKMSFKHLRDRALLHISYGLGNKKNSSSQNQMLWQNV